MQTYVRYICDIIYSWIILRMRNVWDKDVEEIKTHFVFSNFFLENRAVYEIMWKNLVERGRPQMAI